MSQAWGKSWAIFLLGTPYSGTTALHYLLGTSNNVSILGKENTISPDKEGWEKTGLIKHPLRERWDGNLGWVNWEKLPKEYGAFWDTSKPLLVENSPPEIQAPDQLVKHFTPFYGKVRFLLLVRGPCGYHGGNPERSKLYKNVLDKYPEDTFVIRYEDVCLRWEKVFADLVRWEPLLADIDINSIPDESPEVSTDNRLRANKGHRGLHDHANVSVEQYCDSKLEAWAEGLECKDCQAQMDFLKEWGYGDTVDKESCPM